MTQQKWTFRPSSLSLVDYAKRTYHTLAEFYKQDNEEGTRQGISIPAKPTCASVLRTLQWNIHAFIDVNHNTSPEITDGIIDEIIRADADVIVLNEYHWDGVDDRHKKLEQRLAKLGYSCHRGNMVFAPSFMATRQNQNQQQRPMVSEIPLSAQRSALISHVLIDEFPNNSIDSSSCNQNQRAVLVAGTHLDFQDGDQRRKEMSCLLKTLLPQPESSREEEEEQQQQPMIILGDFNQQRQQDYTKEEWNKITAGMDHRRSCHDDDVASLLHNAQFKCAWNYKHVQTNWCSTISSNEDKEHTVPPPPSTHWSGTIVDYSYGNQQVQAQGVYISPVGFSDHRMTVCDWKIL